MQTSVGNWQVKCYLRVTLTEVQEPGDDLNVEYVTFEFYWQSAYNDSWLKRISRK